MTDRFQECLAYVTLLRDEHCRLKDCVQQIEQQWASHVASAPAAGGNTSQVLDSLRALRAELAAHFEAEESGGCIEQAVSRQASLSQEAIELEHEHPVLIGQLDDLIEEMRSCQKQREPTDAIHHRFECFAEQLGNHESMENRILEKGFGIEPE